MTRELAWGFACAIVTFLVYLPSLRNGFLETWDDGTFIIGNGVIRSLGTATLLEAFAATKVHYFAPLTWISMAVDFRVWGLDPFGFHLTNAILHALNAGLVFLVAREVLAAPSIAMDEGPGRRAALITALLWSLHPLRVEAVAWATERKSVLGGLFGLAALLVYLAHARSGRPFWRSGPYFAALALFAGSLLSKPTLVTLPIVLLLVDAYPLRRLEAEGRPRAILEKFPLLAAAVVASLHFSAKASAELTLPDLGPASRVLVALRSVWDYTLDQLWPTGLGPFYLHPGAVTLADRAYTLASFFVVAATVAVVAMARRHPAIAVAWLSWLLALSPGLMATQVSWVERADRFTYFAAIPMTLLAAAAAVRSGSRLGRGARVAGMAGVLGCIVLVAAMTWRQIDVWRDDVTLWTRPIELAPRRSGRVYTERSNARERRGDLGGARADMDSAIEIAESKQYAHVYTLYARRGRILAAMGRFPEAIADLDRAVEDDPSPGVVDTLRERASIHAAMGDDARADADRRRADELEGTR